MKAKYSAAVAIAASSFIFATASAIAGNSGTIVTTQAGNINPGNILQLRPVATCAVTGSPSEFPDDIAIINKGAGVLPKGTKIHWAVAFANKQGNHTLAADLMPGKQVFLSGALGTSVEAGKPCKASVL